MGRQPHVILRSLGKRCSVGTICGLRLADRLNRIPHGFRNQGLDCPVQHTSQFALSPSANSAGSFRVVAGIACKSRVHSSAGRQQLLTDPGDRRCAAAIRQGVLVESCDLHVYGPFAAKVQRLVVAHLVLAAIGPVGHRCQNLLKIFRTAAKACGAEQKDPLPLQGLQKGGESVIGMALVRPEADVKGLGLQCLRGGCSEVGALILGQACAKGVGQQAGVAGLAAENDGVAHGHSPLFFLISDAALFFCVQGIIDTAGTLMGDQTAQALFIAAHTAVDSLHLPGSSLVGPSRVGQQLAAHGGAGDAAGSRLPELPIDYKLAVRQEDPHYGNAGVLESELGIFVPLLVEAGVTSFHVTLANHSSLEDTIPP